GTHPAIAVPVPARGALPPLRESARLSKASGPAASGAPGWRQVPTRPPPKPDTDPSGPAPAAPPLEPTGPLPAPPPARLTDQSLAGRFRLRGLPRQLLGHQLVEAWHVVLDYPVTLVYLPPAAAREGSAVHDFHAAGRGAAQVQHAGLLSIVDTA